MEFHGGGLISSGTEAPKAVHLDGSHIRLQPLNILEDSKELFESSHGEHQWIWRFLFFGPFKTEEDFRKHLVELVKQQVAFTVIDKTSVLWT